MSTFDYLKKYLSIQLTEIHTANNMLFKVSLHLDGEEISSDEIEIPNGYQEPK